MNFGWIYFRALYEAVVVTAGSFFAETPQVTLVSAFSA